MNHIHSLSLRKQIIILFFCSIAITISIILLFQYQIREMLLEYEATHISDSLNQINEEISSSAERTVYYADIIAQNTYTKKCLTEKDPAANTQNTRIFLQTFQALIQNNPNMYNVMLLDMSDIFMGLYSRCFSLVDALENDYSLYLSTSGEAQFTGLVTDPLHNMDYYIYIKPIFQTGIHSRKIGTCLITNPVSELKKTLQNVSLPANSELMILDADNELLVSSTNYPSSTSVDAVVPLILQQKTDSFIARIKEKQCMIQYRTIRETGWKLISIIPINEIYRELNDFNLFFLIIIALIIFVFTVWLYQISNTILKPIQNIVNFMSQGAKHGLKNRLVILRNDEIGFLTGQINTLLNEIESLTNEQLKNQADRYEIALAKTNAELNALQAQINPHFLYNTLDTLKGYGYLLNSTEIVNITNSLSFILRYCIKGSPLVTIEKELQCVNKYMNIIQIRFDDRIRYTIDIEDSILMQEMPRFILQPIIENSVFHGLEALPGNGLLKISGHYDENCIVLIVQDNGIGISPDKLREIQQQLAQPDLSSISIAETNHSIGLLNIQNRLQRLYGNQAGLFISSVPQNNTSVTIRIPL